MHTFFISFTSFTMVDLLDPLHLCYVKNVVKIAELLKALIFQKKIKILV